MPLKPAASTINHPAQHRFISLWAFCAGSIPEELGGLGELQVLCLEENKLTGEAVRAENVARDRKYISSNPIKSIERPGGSVDISIHHTDRRVSFGAPRDRGTCGTTVEALGVTRST